jgi:hypothetical protein
MTKTKCRAAIAQYEATILLVVISLSLGSIVYGGLKKETGLRAEPVFVNEETPIGGNPTIARVIVNSSSVTTITSFGLDEASSKEGVLSFDGSSFSASGSLCAAGATTFFSVLTPQAGTLTVTTSGRAWIAGTYGSAVTVSPGWHEVMIQAGDSCSITLPGGGAVPGRWNSSSSIVSSIPVEGALSGTSFTFYVPDGSGRHRLLMTTTGGFDVVAL